MRYRIDISKISTGILKEKNLWRHECKRLKYNNKSIPLYYTRPSVKNLNFLRFTATDWVTCGYLNRCLMYSRKHQWYWSTEYSDYVNDSDNIEFDSYMVPTSDLELGTLRLLEVDNRLIVPVDTHVRAIVTSTDVIHSFAVPSLGVKIDTIPGRLNQTSFLIKREGVYYGQCSELCGVYHGFMPIVIECVSLEKYLAWLNSQLED